jgi:hypothetical protein
MTAVIDGDLALSDTRVDEPKPFPWQVGTRLFSHLVVWTVVLIPTITEMSRGWIAVLDEATISLRSFQVFSLHPPLLGQYSTTSGSVGHLVYDPGPLQFWLLAVPVRIDPAQGALWGSALLVGLVLSLAVEALWATGHRRACGVMGVAVLVLAWSLPQLFAQPAWNPYFGLVFLVASIVLAWIVATGSLSWWPWLVFTASVSTQAELFFVTFAIVLVVAAPCIGMARRRPGGLRWLSLGVVVGAVCWAPAVIQQLFGASPNLTGLLTAPNTTRLGLSYGFRTLALAGSLHPIWTIHNAGAGLVTFYLIVQSSPIVGAVVLVLIVAIAVIAMRTGRRDLAALAGIAALCSVCVVGTIAIVPAHVGRSTLYLNCVLWPVGILLWMVGVWVAIEVGRIVLGRARTMGASRVPAARPARLSMATGAAAAAGLLLVGAFTASGLTSAAGAQVRGSQNRLVARMAGAVESMSPRGPVVINISSNLWWLSTYSMGQAAAWKLTTDGWQPALPPWFSGLSGIVYPLNTGSPKVTVFIYGNNVKAVRVKQLNAAH